jgi:hypothetical protein
MFYGVGSRCTKLYTRQQQGGTASRFDIIKISVADPDPNPDTDPHVFGPPGSGFGLIREVWIRIRILLSLSKNRKKNLDFYCFVTSF